MTSSYIIRRRVLHFSKKLYLQMQYQNVSVVKGQFINEVNSLTASLKLMKSHLTKHVQDLQDLSIHYHDLKLLLYSNVGIVLGNMLINITKRSLSERGYLSFEAKNQKIVHLVKQEKKTRNTNHSVLIVNLSNLIFQIKRSNS